MYRGYQGTNINEPRERSRDRSSKERNYYDNPTGFDNYGRPYSMINNPQLNNSNTQFNNSNPQFNKKRVKFQDYEDIRVFKKEDQPVAKGLTQDQILQVKLKFQKQITKSYDYNWDQKKHFDALSEQNSIKEQKQKQKELYQKLMSMKEQIQFYIPCALQLPEEVVISNQVQASDSYEKEAHAQRISDVLGCYYTTVNQIPNQPTFQVTTANNKNQPKIIKFHPAGFNQSEQFMSKTNKNQKNLKGILKLSNQKINPSQTKMSEPRQVNPRLIFFLKDMQINKAKYTKQITEAVLKPFKQSGELDYLLNNQALLNQLLKAPMAPTGSNNPQGMYGVPIQPIQNRSSISPSPHGQLKPYFSGGQNQSIGQRNDKFKTVPCKYFHSPQGCVKTQNCTFIHDQRYAGIPTPSMANYTPTRNTVFTPPPLQTSSQQPLAPYNVYSTQVDNQGGNSQPNTQSQLNVQSQYNPNYQNYSQKQYTGPGQQQGNMNNVGYQSQNYQGSYGQNYQAQSQNQGYNAQNTHNYQQNPGQNQGYYSQAYMHQNKGPVSNSGYSGQQYPANNAQYGMYGNNNQNQPRNNNQQGNNHQ